ncbi:MAG: ribonuclease P protein component [Epsilonproteobacteria bacterium]|nr:ribonuclease P protein component [Campylobacterota bacterium]
MKTPKEFSYIYNNAKKRHTESAVIFFKEGSEKKVGFTVSKKIGNAVKRNFAKRRLRSLFLELEESLREGTYVFVAKKAILSEDYQKIKRGVINALKRLKAYET